MELGQLTGGAEPFSSEYTFVRGSYSIGEESVPYYSIAMSLDQAVQSLAFASDVVFDPSEPVQFEELIQREVREERPQQIEEYLLKDKRVKFFNSFTVVLLPVEPGNQNTLLATYPNEVDSEMEDATFDYIDLETIKIRALSSDSNVGYLQWNTNRIKPVIIDGQHRFKAIQTLLSTQEYRARLRPNDTRIPVLALVLHEAAGFTPPPGSETSVLAACRSIFIDLNKHARPVDPTRQYLLDDRDQVAVAMRAILTTDIGVDDGSEQTVEQRVEANGRLPLALVDWSSGKAKFDDGLYLTTVATLYEIVDSALALDKHPAATDYPGLSHYVDLVESRCEIIDEFENWSTAGINDRLEANEHDGIPFDFTDAEVKSAGDAFREAVGPLITRPLIGIKPYAELIAAYTDGGYLGGNRELWLGHDTMGKKAFRATFEAAGGDGSSLERSASEIAKLIKRPEGPNLAFQVVFQKGFIESLLRFDAAGDGGSSSLGLEDGVGRVALAAAWIDRFNERLSPALTDVDRQRSPWLGSGLRLGGNIHYAKAAIGNIACFVSVVLVSPGEIWTEAGTAEESEASEDFRAVVDAELARMSEGAKGELSQQDDFRWRMSEVLAWMWDQREVDLEEAELDERLVFEANCVQQWLGKLERFVKDRADVREEALSEDEAADVALVYGASCIADLASQSSD